MKTFDSYEQEAMLTDHYPRVHRADGASLPVYPALALGGEAGEFSEKVKKAWRDNTHLDQRMAVLELGDVLWYVTAAARDLGYTLADVATMDIDKLRSRRTRGVLAGSGDER